MQLTMQNFRDIVDVGVRLTVETDRTKLLGTIVEKAMDITHCDAGVLSVFENGRLNFRILQIRSQEVSRGMAGEPPVDLPPAPLREDHVCGYTAIHRRVVNIPDVYNSPEFDFSGPLKYDSLTGYHTCSMLVVPMENNQGELLGVLQMINALDARGKIVSFDPEYETIMRAMGSLGAIELSNIAYFADIRRQLHSFVEAMSMAIDERTPYNGSHTRKVAKYAHMLALKINEKHDLGLTEDYFDESRLEKLRLAALLHDIGKIITPRSVMNRATRLDRDLTAMEQRYQLLDCRYENDFLKRKITRQEYLDRVKELKDILHFVRRIDGYRILDDEDYARVQKLGKMVYKGENGLQIPYLTDRELRCLSVRKGTLTPEDRKIMENHVVMTAKILSKVYFTKDYEDVPKWAGQHHEFLDGTGYPNHLTGKDLDLETRILTVADIYDALTSWDRPYKRPMPRDNAFTLLHDMARKGKLEPRLVSWLEEAVKEPAQYKNRIPWGK